MVIYLKVVLTMVCWGTMMYFMPQFISARDDLMFVIGIASFLIVIPFTYLIWRNEILNTSRAIKKYADDDNLN